MHLPILMAGLGCLTLLRTELLAGWGFRSKLVLILVVQAAALLTMLKFARVERVPADTAPK